MRFARNVFLAAGLWGIAVLTPLYFALDQVGTWYPPAVTHPDFYYGFVGVALVWQAAFLLIARDTARYRPMMIVAILEKFVYVASLIALYAEGRLQGGQVMVVGPDFILGILFIAAFRATSEAASAWGHKSPPSSR